MRFRVGKLRWLWAILSVTIGTSISNASIILFDIAGAGAGGLRSTNERTDLGAAATILGIPGSGGEASGGRYLL